MVNKKESILVAALKLLAEKGVHNTPMSAIAKAADTGMGTIYNHFPNKEILINAIYVSIKEREKAVFPAFELNQPIKTQFEMYLASMIAFFIENPVSFKFMEQLQASPIITEESKVEGVKAVENVLLLLKKGKQDRIIKDVETDELLMFIGGAILSYLRYYFMNQSNKPSLSNLKQVLWDGIRE